jgi:two-component system, OmpR family, sensor histidine kinase KdpD
MKRWSSLVRWILSIFFAIGIVLICSLLLIPLRPYLSTSVVALLYLVPVVISSAVWGIFAGAAASILSFLIFNYFFLPPYYNFRVAHPQDFLAMIVLLSVAILISLLMARAQANLQRAKDRERDAIQLSALSFDLVGKTDGCAIANILAQRLAEYFVDSVTEIEVIQPGEKVFVRCPPSRDLMKTPPEKRLPLSSPRGSFGEIRIWGLPEDIKPEEERLLQTFASQGALALDRAILSIRDQQARVLEESDRLKTAILSSVSHELRTPLASIQASATTLFHPSGVQLGPEARSELQAILLEETENMSQLVGNLLNMSRIEANALKLQREWNSITEIIDNCVKRLERISGQHHIEVNASEDLPLVSFDPVLIEQVLINLVNNSIKFAPPQTTICIYAEADDQVLKTTVSNQGPPIPEEHIEHIFEKFYPIPGRDAKRSTGLGLSICKGIIEAHNAAIWAENLPTGVAFTFTIPLTWEGARPVLPIMEEEQ